MSFSNVERNIRRLLKRRSSRDDRGATLVEYALLLALIAVVAVGSLVFLGQGTTRVFTLTATGFGPLDGAGGGVPGGPGPILGDMGAPIPLTAISGPGVGQITLSWGVPSNQSGALISGYDIFVGPPGSNQVTGAVFATTSATTDTVTLPLNDTQYYFDVEATTSLGNSPPAGPTPMYTPSAPGVPVLTPADGTDGAAGSVVLNWTTPAPTYGALPITKYQVLQTGTSTVLCTPVSIPAGYPNADTCTVTGLGNTAAYSLTVAATNAAGTTDSLAATGTTDSPPGTPVLTATAASGEVILNWTNPSPADGNLPTTGYQIFQNGAFFANVSGATLTYTDTTGITNGTTYTFYVIATNNAGSTDSNTATATPELGESGPPTLQPPTTPGVGEVTLTWTPPADTGGCGGFLYYEVYENGNLVAVTFPGQTTYTVMGLSSDTQYSFDVEAVCIITPGAPSNTQTVTTIDGPPDAPALSGTASTTTVSGSANLTWTAPANDGGSAITEYRVFRDGNPVVTLTGATFATSYTVNGLTDGTTYDFTVEAGNTSGFGAASNDVFLQPVAPNPTIGAFQISPDVTPQTWGPSYTFPTSSGGTIDLQWTGLTNAVTCTVNSAPGGVGGLFGASCNNSPATNQIVGATVPQSFTHAGNTTYTITLHVAGGGGSTTQTATVTAIVPPLPPVPTITSVVPNSGPTAGGTSVTITGTNLTGATAVTFDGFAGTGVIVNGPGTSLTVTTPADAAGPANVAVTTPGGTANDFGAFTYIPPAPTITTVLPASGPTVGGTTVTITGTNLTGATVNFGANAGTFVNVNGAGTSLTVRTPAGAAGAVNVKVTTTGGSATDFGAFTYVAAPTITTVLPNSGPTAGGTPVTITGTNLTGATAVTFDGVAGTGVIVNGPGTSLTVTTPAGAAGAVTVSVTTPGGTANDFGAFTYIPPAPTITTVLPASGPTVGGTTVTITGTNLTGATVNFGANAGTFVNVNGAGTSLTVRTPAGAAGAVNVKVTTTGGSATDFGAFTYVAAPTITTVLPNSGPTAGGTPVTIAGTNLTGAAVTFGGVAGTGVIVNGPGTSLTVTTPAGAAGAVTVSVTTPGGTANDFGAFTYIPPAPTITTVLPATGTHLGGTTVTITGTNLTGATVNFGANAGSNVNVNGAGTSLTVRTPAGAAGAVVNVKVTTTGGSATDSGAFTYT